MIIPRAKRAQVLARCLVRPRALDALAPRTPEAERPLLPQGLVAASKVWDSTQRAHGTSPLQFRKYAEGYS